ncbi:MAG: calcium/sodium antiporter [Melioribacteraceae bacterium]|nr:calcium/sodium antiporter [Melioribacteraceae bacterium]
MELFISILLIILGFLLLIKGADILIDGSSALASKWNISQLVIGLTIVSFGTSAPELIVNLFAAFEGSTSVSFGNIVGSNIANIFLILGVAAIIKPLSTQKNTVWKEIPFTLLAGLVLLVLCNDSYFSPVSNVLSQSDGIILLLLFLLFIVYVFSISKAETVINFEVKQFSNLKISLFILGGLAGLMLGGKLVVDNAINIAAFFSVSERIIGLTLVALGTSLPELFTTVIAVKKGEMDIGVGNVVGSNIFNVFFILGATSIISPIPIFSAMNFDLLVMTTASLFLFFSMFTGKKRVIDRWEGIVFLLLYLLYNTWLFSN